MGDGFLQEDRSKGFEGFEAEKTSGTLRSETEPRPFGGGVEDHPFLLGMGGA